MLFRSSPTPASTIHGRFEQQAALRPRAIALECDGVRLTYREVNEDANRIARRIAEAGGGVESLVLISMQRSCEVVSGMLAVLKAGAAFTVSEGMPSGERLEGLIRHSGVRLAVTDSPLAFAGRRIKAVSGYVTSGLAQNPAVAVRPDQWACEAAGQLCSHATVLRFLDDMRELHGLRSADGMFSATEISGQSGLELLLPLTIGARLVLASVDEVRDPAVLEDAIRAAECKLIRLPRAAMAHPASPRPSAAHA